jgi:hypothetical protein
MEHSLQSLSQLLFGQGSKGVLLLCRCRRHLVLWCCSCLVLWCCGAAPLCSCCCAVAAGSRAAPSLPCCTPSHSHSLATSSA